MIKNKELLDRVGGYISEKNKETLQEYIGKLTGDKIVVVDVGTMAGLSALTMASTADNVYVLTIDPGDASSKDIEENSNMMGVGDRVKFFHMTSEEFGKNHCPDEIDACFIDGRHEAEWVRKDIELIAAKVKKGGYIMFHDKNLYDFGSTIEEFEGKLYKFIEEKEQEIEPKTGRPYGTVYVVQRI